MRYWYVIILTRLIPRLKSGGPSYRCDFGNLSHYQKPQQGSLNATDICTEKDLPIIWNKVMYVTLNSCIHELFGDQQWSKSENIAHQLEQLARMFGAIWSDIMNQPDDANLWNLISS